VLGVQGQFTTIDPAHLRHNGTANSTRAQTYNDFLPRKNSVNNRIGTPTSHAPFVPSTGLPTELTHKLVVTRDLSGFQNLTGLALRKF